MPISCLAKKTRQRLTTNRLRFQIAQHAEFVGTCPLRNKNSIERQHSQGGSCQSKWGRCIERDQFAAARSLPQRQERIRVHSDRQWACNDEFRAETQCRGERKMDIVMARINKSRRNTTANTKNGRRIAERAKERNRIRGRTIGKRLRHPGTFELKLKLRDAGRQDEAERDQRPHVPFGGKVSADKNARSDECMPCR